MRLHIYSERARTRAARLPANVRTKTAYRSGKGDEMKWKCAFAHEPKCILHLIYFVFAGDAGVRRTKTLPRLVQTSQARHNEEDECHASRSIVRTNLLSRIFCLCLTQLKNQIMVDRSFMIGIRSQRCYVLLCDVAGARDLLLVAISSDIMFYAYTYACVISRRISYAHRTRYNTSPSRYIFVFEFYVVFVVFAAISRFARSLFSRRCRLRCLIASAHILTHLYICCFCHWDFNFLPRFFFIRACVYNVRHVFTMIK